jgi:Cu/Zn superoxide dismutase
MTTEAGDKKLLGNFSKLIDHISAAANYNPANTKLSKTSLQAQRTSGDAAILGVATNGAANKLAITERQLGHDELSSIAIRSRDYLKASGQPKMWSPTPKQTS